MICSADTVGVFQIESRAQMSMLPRLQPRTLLRPGDRGRDRAARADPGRHGASLSAPPAGARACHLPERRHSKPALGRTLGVPIFQEQVMQVAILAAGFTPGEADQLRRAMAAWKRKGGLEKYYDRIVDGMLRARLRPANLPKRIFEQIQGFGEYGFPGSHAASFALLAYASCWLKCHEPAAFLRALLNSQPMGFYCPSQLVQDAQRHGVAGAPVDVTISGWDSRLEAVDDRQTRQPAVRLGLSLLSGHERRTRRSASRPRARSGRSRRHRPGAPRAARPPATCRCWPRQCAGSLAGNRREALVAGGRRAVPDKDLLRPTTPHRGRAPRARRADGRRGHRRRLPLAGLTLGRHPLALLRPRCSSSASCRPTLRTTIQNGQLARGCGIVTVRQRPGTAKGVLFVTLEDETGNVNVIVWPQLVEQQRQEVLGAPLLGVYGIWQREGEVRHLVAKRLVDMSHLLGGLTTSAGIFADLFPSTA